MTAGYRRVRSRGTTRPPGLGLPAALCVAMLGMGLAATRGSAQVVRGTVVEVGDSSPIADARLVLRDVQGGVLSTAVSGSDGRFVLRASRTAFVRLEVSHLAYADWWTANFLLTSDDEIEIAVRLGVSAILLEPIAVVAEASATRGRLAGFEQRRTSPGGFGGYFLTADEIERRPVATPSSLVIGTPGMTVGRAEGAAGLERTVILSRGCIARLFVDGVRVTQMGGGSIDDLLSPDLIAGVEMYPRGMSAPPQYQDTREPECGVVLFWTKEARSDIRGGRSFGRIAIGFGILGAILTLAIIG